LRGENIMDDKETKETKNFLYGFYALRFYLPFSGLARSWQRFWKKRLNKKSQLLQQINLPKISWKKCTPVRKIKIWETETKNGNVRISELAMLNALAAHCEDGANIFEIGTFDGRTTLNMTFSSSSNCRIYTLDLMPEMETRFNLAAGERHMVEVKVPAERLMKHLEAGEQAVQKIRRLFGDSAKFDFSPFKNSCSLVFVDGSHAYDYVKSDTRNAMKIVKPGGVIVWHDYGIWSGVTKALEEIEAEEKIGLRNIRGTSLVFWKKV